MTNHDYYLQDNKSFARLLYEYEKYKSLVIGFDFDGTVHDFHNNGDKFDKVIKLLRDLKKIGCKLVCWTAHPNLDYVNNYLVEHKIPFDGINTGGIPLAWKSSKPLFSALLDDRAGLKQVYDELTKLVEYVQSTKS
jgi:hypothetical protein